MPDGRSFQVAGRPKQMSRQSVVVGRVGFHVENDDVLTARDQDALDRAGQFDGFLPSALLLAGIDDLGGLADGVLLKEPLSFRATRSALAVVHPVNGGHVFHSRGR